MNIYRVLPSLAKDRQMKIWHKALRSQWSATDLDWERPQRMTLGKLKDELAKVLTPVLMGEQSALYSVSGLIPILGRRFEVESQFYLTTWAVDEARHTELFTRFYARIEREPLSIRRAPAGYLFQSRIVSEDPAEWLTGVLVSETLALRLMHRFKELDLDPVLSDICDGIIVDEARHLGFNHLYLEDRFAALHSADPGEAEAFAERLRLRLDYVMEGVLPIFDDLDAETRSVGLQPDQLVPEVREESRKRLEKSIAAGIRLGDGRREEPARDAPDHLDA